MSLILRHYQEEAIYSLYDYFERNTGNPIIALPTGTGKSLVIAEFLRSIFHYFRSQRVIIGTHVKELIQQNAYEFVEVWPLAPVGIYSAGLKVRQVAPIIFGGIGSMVKKADLFGKTDLLIVDECHLISPKEDTMYRKFIEDLKKNNPYLKVIGLTATPYRLGQGLLTESISTPNGAIKNPIFTDICCDWTSLEKFNQLIAEGYLCPLIPKRTSKEVDVSKVGLIAGEFNITQLQETVDKDEITSSIVEETITTAFGDSHPRLRWLIFASGVNHSDHIATELCARGIDAKSIHSRTPPDLRDLWIEEFRQPAEPGEIKCLVNNNVLTTGFNVPAVDLIGVARWTNSPGLWVQMLGRGTRPAPGKENCLVLDFARNTRRLGPINDPVIPKQGRRRGGNAPIKVCEVCGTYNHAAVRICVSCGAEFPAHIKYSDEASTDEVIRSSVPLVEVFAVDHVEYKKHSPKNRAKPDSLMVSYWSGYRMFSQWVCLEHEGFASKKARDWWRERAEDPNADPPATIDEALLLVNDLIVPTAIRVWVNKSPPEILSFDFTESMFGQAGTLGKPEFEDDIPF